MRVIGFVFLVFGIVELMLLFMIGGHFGAMKAWLIVLVGWFFGVAVMARSGRTGLGRLQAAASGTYVSTKSSRSSPLFVFLAGLLMFVPGPISLIIGALLLIPAVQGLVRGLLVDWFHDKNPGGYTASQAAGAAGSRFSRRNSTTVVQGEVVDENTGTGTADKRGSSGLAIEGEIISPGHDSRPRPRSQPPRDVSF